MRQTSKHPKGTPATRELPAGIRLNFPLPPDVHMQAKVAAAFRRQTLQDFTIDALRAAINSSPEKSIMG